MKLVTFDRAGYDRVGAVVDSRVLDLNAAYAALLVANGDAEAPATAGWMLPADMLDFIRGGADTMVAAQEALRFVRERGLDVLRAVFPLDCVRLRAPASRDQIQR
jgi:acylpyruvate hydrolase